MIQNEALCGGQYDQNEPYVRVVTRSQRPRGAFEKASVNVQPRNKAGGPCRPFLPAEISLTLSSCHLKTAGRGGKERREAGVALPAHGAHT